MNRLKTCATMRRSSFSSKTQVPRLSLAVGKSFKAVRRWNELKSLQEKRLGAVSGTGAYSKTHKGNTRVMLHSIALPPNPTGFSRGNASIAQSPVDDRLTAGRRVIGCNRGHFRDDEAFFA
jgi:hypothetical protein